VDFLIFWFSFNFVVFVSVFLEYFVEMLSKMLVLLLQRTHRM